MPRDMRTLIETYDTVAPGLYRIANYFSASKLDAPFVFDVAKVAIKAPIKYPYNLLAVAANYKLHAGEMFAPGQPAAESRQRSRSGQGRSGLLRQVAALVHHRS